MSTRDKEEDIAWGHFLSQHKRAQNAENFTRAFYQPTNPLAFAADDMLQMLDYESVTGDRLDLVGSIVGASRIMPTGITLSYFGFSNQAAGRGFGIARMRHEGEPITQSYTASDTEYKQLIKIKIMLNNGHGTASELAEAAKIAFAAPVASARDAGPAAVELWVGRIPGTNEGIGKVIPDFLPRAAGVKISLKFWDANLPFGFSNNNQYGFGVGIMARTPLT